MGRPVEKSDHDAVAHREAARRWYQRLSRQSRREYAQRRDPQAQREADNRRYAKDQGKRDAARSDRANPAKESARRIANTNQKPGPACENCGARTNLELHHPDHRIPNKTVTLCSTCNSRQADTTYKGVRRD